MNQRSSNTSSMATIETLTKGYADARELLAATMAALTEERNAVTKKYLKRVRDLVARAKERRRDLREALEAAPELFDKPKTQTFHGVKVGYRKATGKIEFDDADQVVKLIRKHFPEQFDVLVKVDEKPIKKALGNLTAAELKKLGIEVSESGEAVFIGDASDEFYKMVDALLAENDEEDAS